MQSFYKIPKIDANKIGKFEYDNLKMVDPFCSEQVDGTYLVSVDLVTELSDNENIKKVDWSSMTIINESQINTKVVNLH